MIARAKDGRYFSSPSARQRYWECGEAFRLSHDRDALRDPWRENEDQAVGSLVHAILEGVASGLTPLAALESALVQAQVPGEGADGHDQALEALELVRASAGLVVPYFLGQVLGCETRGTYDLGDNLWDALRVDLVVAPPSGGVTVVDWKKGQSPDEAPEEQGWSYARWARATWPDRGPWRVDFVYLGDQVTRSLTWSEEGEQVSIARSRAACKAAMAGYFKPRLSAKCGDCRVLPSCPEGRAYLGKYPLNAGEALPLFEEEVRLKEWIKAAEARRETLDALLRPLVNKGPVRGDGYRARKRSQTRTYYDDQAVDDLARASGVEAVDAWRRMASVSTKALKEFVGDDPQLEAVVAPHKKQSTSSWVEVQRVRGE